MRLDLSSYITLERIPQRYYKPENDFEEYTLSRFEKMPLNIYEQVEVASVEVADDSLRQVDDILILCACTKNHRK